MKHDYHEARLVATAIGIIPAIWVYLVDLSQPGMLVGGIVVSAFCLTITFILLQKAKKWQKEQQLETQDE